MADPKDADATMEDDYDEEADSDFDAGKASDDMVSSSTEGEDDDQIRTPRKGRPRPQLQPKRKGKSQTEPLELDSGDEATIQERSRLKQKQKQKQRGNYAQDDHSDSEEQGWRARTRAMREKDQVEKKRSKLASVKGSTVDVDQIWEAMNTPGGMDDLLEPVAAAQTNDGTGPAAGQKENIEPSDARSTSHDKGKSGAVQQEQDPLDDIITIEETYEFAGEVHTRRKAVPRSSAEAKVWLTQRPSHHSDPRFPGNEPIRRPLRKISRFDPNLNNLDSFKKNWEKALTDGKGSKVHKLNTVEKSKMDWAAHVDQEGLQDELSEHAKAKGGYLGRMDFLGQVEQRKEEEARRVRVQG